MRTAQIGPDLRLGGTRWFDWWTRWFKSSIQWRTRWFDLVSWPTVFTLGLRRYEIIHSSINTKAKKTTKRTHLLEQRLAKPIRRHEGAKRTQRRNTCAPATAFWLVDNSHTTWSHQNLTRLFIGPNSSVLAIGSNQSLRGIYITWGYTFWSSIENFSAYSRVLRRSILLPPRWQKYHSYYLNFDEVSWITLKSITKCDGIITNYDSLVYYKMRWTVVTNCDRFFITKCDTVYYKLRRVLQSAKNLLQIATGITKCDDYYKLRQYRRDSQLLVFQDFFSFYIFRRKISPFYLFR